MPRKQMLEIKSAKVKECVVCLLLIYLFIYFWLHCAACEILVPQSGIEPGPPQ